MLWRSVRGQCSCGSALEQYDCALACDIRIYGLNAAAVILIYDRIDCTMVNIS